MCKRILIFKLQTKSSYWQIIDFSRNCPKFHIFTKILAWVNTLFQFCQLWAVNKYSLLCLWSYLLNPLLLFIKCLSEAWETKGEKHFPICQNWFSNHKLCQNKIWRSIVYIILHLTECDGNYQYFVTHF